MLSKSIPVHRTWRSSTRGLSRRIFDRYRFSFAHILVVCVRLAVCMTLVRSSFADMAASDPHQQAQMDFKSRSHDKNPWPREDTVLWDTPGWEDEHTQQPLCAPGSDLTGGKMYKTEHDDLVYEPKECRLRRLTADAARRCLKNRHVAFIGDSVTRYQYLSLAYFLSKKHPEERYGEGQRLTWEKDWPSWTEFFRGSTARLEDALEGCAIENCDCQRDGAVQRRSLMTELREFRRFDLRFPFPCGASTAPRQDRLLLSYYVTFGQPNEYDGHSGGDALHYYMRHIHEEPPTDIIYNEGLWYLEWPMDRLETFLARMVKYFEVYRAHPHDDQPPAFVSFKTTTQTERYSEERSSMHHAAEVSIARAAGLNVTDAYALTQALHEAKVTKQAYVDGMHFQPFVYEQLNDILLNQLC